MLCVCLCLAETELQFAVVAQRQTCPGVISCLRVANCYTGVRVDTSYLTETNPPENWC